MMLAKKSTQFKALIFAFSFGVIFTCDAQIIPPANEVNIILSGYHCADFNKAVNAKAEGVPCTRIGNVCAKSYIEIPLSYDKIDHGDENIFFLENPSSIKRDFHSLAQHSELVNVPVCVGEKVYFLPSPNGADTVRVKLTINQDLAQYFPNQTLPQEITYTLNLPKVFQKEALGSVAFNCTAENDIISCQGI